MTDTVKSFLDRLLTQGKGLAQKGEDFAADKLGVDDTPEARSTMRKTALAGGTLALLLGTRTGRRLTRTGVVLGGLGMLGKMAYDAYNKSGNAPADAAPPVAALEGPAAEQRASAIAAAVIAAAKADGHVDDKEMAAIEQALSGLPATVSGFLRAELHRTPDAKSIAALADSPQAAGEMWLASYLVTGDDHPGEKEWLASLAAEMGLGPDRIAALKAEAGV